jgi:hypothetical protein
MGRTSFRFRPGGSSFPLYWGAVTSAVKRDQTTGAQGASWSISRSSAGVRGDRQPHAGVREGTVQRAAIPRTSRESVRDDGNNQVTRCNHLPRPSCNPASGEPLPLLARDRSVAICPTPGGSSEAPAALPPTKGRTPGGESGPGPVPGAPHLPHPWRAAWPFDLYAGRYGSVFSGKRRSGPGHRFNNSFMP